jgi:hypothetical protein
VTELPDGTKLPEYIVLNAENNWNYIQKGLPLCTHDHPAKTIEYTWKEVEPENYKLTGNVTNGRLTTLTNEYGPAETKVNVRKVWNDNNDSLKKRPEDVTVQLFADGVAIDKPVTLSASNEWSYTWEGLKKNVRVSNVTKAIQYTVEEIDVPEGYRWTVTGGEGKDGFAYTITNIYDKGKLVIEKKFQIDTDEVKPEEEPEYVDVPVVKLWKDNENRDGNRPSSITVRLLAGGNEIAAAELSAATGWTYEFQGLPRRNDNGEVISYSITEDKVPWYSSSINGYTITNTYEPELTSATVRKVWNDDGNDANLRPTSIYMTLYNGNTEVTRVLLSTENNWMATVDNLPTMVNGQPANYKWEEQTVLSYDRENIEQQGTVTTFTNKMWERQQSTGEEPAKKPGNKFYVFEEYETPLGVEIMINHVGDCFD